MRQEIGRLIKGCAIVSFAMSTPETLHASISGNDNSSIQNTAENASRATPNGAGYVCLTNTVKGGSAGGHIFKITVPADRVDKYLSRGFVVAECSRVQRKAIARSVENACTPPAGGDPIAISRIWHQFSIKPGELCGEIGEKSAQ